MADSNIEWCNKTWNPTIGCVKVSAGCTNCYAIRQAYRNALMGHLQYEGLTRKLPDGSVNWTGLVRMLPERLGQPLRWKKPARIFVDSMSDLFHEDVPDEFIAAVFGVMAGTPWHTYQVLTKRPRRALRWFEWISQQSQFRERWIERVAEAERMCGEVEGSRGARWTVLERAAVHRYATDAVNGTAVHFYSIQPWPLPNVWMGVSVEDQRAADERIPLLLQTPAAVRFLSAEPLLGPIDLSSWLRWPDCTCQGEYVPCEVCDAQGPRDELGWVIAGGESGPNYRPMDPDWARSLRDQCQAAGIAFHFKQVGGRTHAAGGRMLDGREWSEFPEPAREVARASR